MSSEEIVVQVTSLSKRYEIYDRPSDRLKQFIFPRLRRFFGKSSVNYFREFWALRDLSFVIRRGEAVGIIGRNGSGKSTLLQIICGTMSPTYGEVKVNGRVAALLELGSGFNPEFTGRENVYLNASVLGLSGKEIEESYAAIVKFADIGEFIEQPVKTYSSGMMVRLAFAVIAHVDADILIIDEALAVGDAFFSQKCMRFLRDFMKTGTVFFVTHDTGALTNLCSKGILLKSGRILEIDSPKKVVESYLTSIYESKETLEFDQNSKLSVPKESDKEHIKCIGIQESSELLVQKNSEKEHIESRDTKQSFNDSKILCNDIEVLKFDFDAVGSGTGYASFKSVNLLNFDALPLSWICGGEDVVLEIKFLALRDIVRPIIGFQIKDKLGQIIFGDNSYISYKDKKLLLPCGKNILAKFQFKLPLLPTGDYCIAVGIAGGTQVNHIMHSWIHEAAIFRVHSALVPLGLIGLPMRSIELVIIEK